MSVGGYIKLYISEHYGSFVKHKGTPGEVGAKNVLSGLQG